MDPSGLQEYQIDWGYNTATGQPLLPPPAAFGPGGYYGGQYGYQIPYNSETTVNGPAVPVPPSNNADSNLPVSGNHPIGSCSPLLPDPVPTTMPVFPTGPIALYVAPTPCPLPTPIIGRAGQVTGFATLGVAALVTGGIEIRLGIMEWETGNKLWGAYEIGHGGFMAVWGLYSVAGAFLAGFRD